MQGVSSWRIDEDFSMPLTVALFIRDPSGLPTTTPFFVPAAWSRGGTRHLAR